MQRRWPTYLRAVLAALTLAAIVVGVPLLLVREVGWPLPSAIPSWDDVSRSITTGSIADATIIKALAVLVWLAWANFASGAVIEGAAVARGGVARRVAGLGPAQHLAANLIATISLAITLLTRPAAAASAAPTDLRLAVASSSVEHGPQLLDLTRCEPTASSIGRNGSGVAGHETVTLSASVTQYEVQRGDTLWDVSDRLLGDGMRWREIRDINIGRQQPDGTVIGADTEDLEPGWVLSVPGSRAAQPGAASSVLPAAADDGDQVVVERGDTLWDLADELLDDPYRWPEIYEENRGDPQPDGRALIDPDLIQPGWVLDLPPAHVVEMDGAPPPTEQVQLPVDEAADPPVASVEATPDAAEASELTADVAADEAEDEQASTAPAVVESRAPTSTPEPSSSTSAEVAAEDGADDIALVPIAAAGTVAAGLVLTLDRIRRARLRRRQPHHRIPLPTGEEAAAERRLRAHGDVDRDRLLNLALRELSGHYEDHRAAPPVVLASHGPADVAVHLDAASDASPDGWQRHDRDHTWSRHRPADLNAYETHLGTPARFPALVTIGALSGGRVGLLNLAHTGCLHVDGLDAEARRLMAAWALELATTPRADALDVVTVGLDDLPDGLERLQRLADADELREVLSQPHTNGKTNLPRTVIVAAGLPSDVAVLLRTTSEFRSDLVAVVSGMQPRSGNWVVQLDGHGRARLEPEGIAFDLLDLGPEAARMTAKLIEQALHDPEQLVQLPDDEPTTIDLAVNEPDEQDTSPAHDLTVEPTTEVRVLGPVAIVGAVEPFRTNKTIELIVYLALRRSGATADTILEALWPGQQPRPARLYTEASRARRALGTAPDGSPHFPDAELGRYRLADSVALDHDRFKSAVGAARRDPDSAIDHLRRALLLVRGVPLSATATEYSWATNEFYALAQEVVDAAHDLAQLSLAAEQYDDAIWAAERGLLADPLAEVLVRDIMEAAAATGNTSRVHAAMNRLRRAVSGEADANDADDWLHPETLNCFRRLIQPRLDMQSGTGRPVPSAH